MQKKNVEGERICVMCVCEWVKNGSGKAQNGSKTVAGEGNLMHDLSVRLEKGKSLCVYVNNDFSFFFLQQKSLMKLLNKPALFWLFLVSLADFLETTVFILLPLERSPSFLHLLFWMLMNWLVDSFTTHQTWIHKLRARVPPSSSCRSRQERMLFKALQAWKKTMHVAGFVRAASWLFPSFFISLCLSDICL